MSAADETPYEQLLTLGICELELARAGRIVEMAACQEARAELMAALPAVPPPCARPVLERCQTIQRQIEWELGQARETVLSALADLQRAHRAARGYAPVRPRLQQVRADA